MRWGFDEDFVAEMEEAGRLSGGEARPLPRKRRVRFGADRQRKLTEHCEAVSESDLQRRVVRWLRGQGLPCYATSNERSDSARQISRLKAQGMTPGIPDLTVPVPSGPYGALYIELKRGGNDLTPAQAEQIRALEEAGNACVVCYTLGQVQTFVREYLADPEHFVGGC